MNRRKILKTRTVEECNPSSASASPMGTHESLACRSRAGQHAHSRFIQSRAGTHGRRPRLRIDMSRQALFALSLMLISTQTQALNILVVVSLPLRSHYMAFQTLFKELAVRGHNVTVINNYPDKQPPPTLEFINLEPEKKTSQLATLEYYESIGTWYLEWYNIYRHLVVSPDFAKMDCEKLFTNENVKRLLARKVKYDVIFAEQFMSDCGLAFAASKFDSPIIGITSHVLLPKHYPRLGLPFDISADPHYFFNTGTKPTFLQRVEIAIADYLFLTLSKFHLERSINEVFEKYMPNNYIDVEKLSYERMKMIFSYQHYSITGGRLLAPQVLEIAGIHIEKPKPIPDDLEKFMSTAEKGVIYISFGSNLKANTMSNRMLQQFLEAFKRVPQKIIWKWENGSIPQGNDNVLTGDWFPQLDILCHQKTLAFITHGGMLSMSEAAHCGKPLLTMPFFGDQFNNAAAARESGLGLTMFFQNADTENLVKAINKLTSERMRASAQRVSRLWHDRPQKVMDSAIYWTEYVARHGNSPPPRPTKRSVWYFPTNLDVICAIIIIIVTILFIIYSILRLFMKLFFKVFFKLCKRKDKSD